MVDKPPPDDSGTRGKVAQVRIQLFIVFGLGLLGLIYAVAWATRGMPEGGLPKPVPVAGGGMATRETAPLGTCKKFGDRCEHSPGKLGTCVARGGQVDQRLGREVT